MNYYLIVLKKYADFKGRARRSEYWYFILFSSIISVILSVATSGIGTLKIISSLYTLAVFVPSIAVGVRRMHDVNKSGWFLIVPIYNLILACTNGTEGPNDYGVDPKNPEFIDEVEQIGNNA